MAEKSCAAASAGWAPSGSAESSPRLFSVRMAQELAHQKRRGIETGLLGEALRERLNVAVREIHLYALNAMHGKKDHSRSKGLAALDLHREIVEPREIDASQAESFTGEMKNRAPEFFPRVAQRGDDERPRSEGADGLRLLIKAGAGHNSIVVCEDRNSKSNGNSSLNVPLRSLPPSNQSPPAQPSYKDATAPAPAPAPCSKSGDGFASAPPKWFVFQTHAPDRLTGWHWTSSHYPPS